MVIAMAAQRNIIITIDILVPDAFPAAFAGGSVVFQAVRTCLLYTSDAADD